MGVVFEENMSRNKQVNEIRKKACFSLQKVRKISPLLNEDYKMLLLNTLVLPHINYCCSSWNTTSAANTKKFESFIRSIDKIHPMNKTFQKMKTYENLLMAFKGINNNAPRYLVKHSIW